MANKYSDQSYFMSHILPVYKRASVWDDNICLIVQGEHGSIYSYKTAMGKDKRYLVGSCCHGACSPRMYRVPPVLEVDIMVSSNTCGKDEKLVVQCHPNKVGVYVDKGVPRQLLWHTVGIFYPEEVLNPSSDSPRHVLEAHHKAEDIIARNPQYLPQWYKNCDITFSNKGPSLKGAYIRHNTCTQILEDNVAVIPIPGWPEEAEEWRTRARLWPPASVVEQILKEGYHITPKWSSSTCEADGFLEYHITFALGESLLAKHRTPVQKLVYLMAKTLFYTHLDLHDDDNPNMEFPSYALKTSMMWTMEKTGIEKWQEDKVLYLLRELLTHLQTNVSTGTLKNYFMIGVNVLSNCTQNLLQKTNTKLTEILLDINTSLQSTELYKCNVLLYGYCMFKGGKKAYDEVVYGCQNEVLVPGLLEAIKNKHKVRATYKRIVEILERGTGEGLQAKGYLFDEEECYHVLKTMLNVHSDLYKRHENFNILSRKVRKHLGRYPLEMEHLIKKEFFLEPHPYLLEEVTIVRMFAQWQGRKLVGLGTTAIGGDRDKEFAAYLKSKWYHNLLKKIACLPGETDLIVVREGADINVYKWSDMGDLIEHYVRDLQDNEVHRWMPQIYSLTHRDIPELQLMDWLRMLYLLYVCDEKRSPV